MFVAHLLEYMGYTARVTQRSGGGGVDVIAHRGNFGFVQPILKVQCKRKTDQVPLPRSGSASGHVGDGEYGLFITLGSYRRHSIDLERNRAKLRLINGEQFVEMPLENYPRLFATLPRDNSPQADLCARPAKLSVANVSA